MTIKQLQAAYDAADQEYRAANAALGALIAEWQRLDHLVRTAGRGADPLAIAQAERDMIAIGREAPQVEGRVKDAALARYAAEQALHRAQGEAERSRRALAWLSDPDDAAVERYGVRQLQAEEQRLKALVRQLEA